MISASDAQAISSAANGADVSSVQSIDSFPPELQAVVRDAFREGSRWAFISLIPWAGVAVISSLFLSNIKDRMVSAGKGDKEATPVEVPMHDVNGKAEQQTAGPAKLQ